MTYQPLADTGETRKYFAMIPHMMDDVLDVYEYRVYGHLVRRAGERRELAISVGTIAEYCGISKGTVIKAKDGLQTKGFIKVSKRGEREADLITIINVWADNIAKYDVSGQEMTTKWSGDDHKPAFSGQEMTTKKNNILEEKEYIFSASQANADGYENSPIQQGELLGNDTPPKTDKVAKTPKPPKEPKPAKAKQPSQHWEMITCLAEKFGVDAKLNAGRLGREAKTLLSAGYTIDDVKWFAEKEWPKDWRYDNGQKMNEAILNTGIKQAKENRLKAPPPKQWREVQCTHPFTGKVTTERVFI